MAGKQDSGVGGQERGPFREGLRSVGTQSEGSHAGIKVQGMPPWVRSIFHSAERRGKQEGEILIGGPQIKWCCGKTPSAWNTSPDLSLVG